nr:GTPase-associated system all-helical protein GASH [Corallococcus exercitus]
MLTKGRRLQQARIEEWRNAYFVTQAASSTTYSGAQHNGDKLDLPSLDPEIPIFQPQKQPGGAYDFGDFGTEITDILTKQTTALATLDNRTRPLFKAIHGTEGLLNQLNLIWWGQARYSPGTRKPYRRIKDSAERLWWMAWEASELAIGLSIEPAVSFFVEVLQQVDGELHIQRPLKEWIGELIHTLRQIQRSEQSAKSIAVGNRLKALATEDSLGLPITWARLEAALEQRVGPDFETRAHEKIALDMDTRIDRGEWAAWLFREALLDRYLREE